MNSNITPLQRIVWESLLDSDMNARYWRRLGRRYYSLDKAAKIFVAVASSAVVASWALWKDFPELWKLLSGVSAIVALIQPFADWSGQARSMAALRAKWSHLETSYEVLWAKSRQMTDAELESALGELKVKENDLIEPEANLPHDDDLLEQCFNEVIVSRGLA